MSKTCLVVIYNHNFERNIDIIKRIYGQKFSVIRQIMPFYYGDDETVISVFGGSFQFHEYIAQAKKELMAIECDRYLFIGDDLLLNPEFNESNVEELLNLKAEDAYLDGFVDVSRTGCYRGTMEAHNFSTQLPGVDSSANRMIPSFDDAFETLHRKGLMNTIELKEATPYFPDLRKPLFKNLYDNYKIMRGWAWHIRNALAYEWGSRKASYPVVFAYSDIFSVSKNSFPRVCQFLEIFATWRMFVELAIPTSLALLEDIQVVTNENSSWETGNVWFPQDPKEFIRKEKIINELAQHTGKKIEMLKEYFPSNMLYLHPVKLSQWS